MITIKEKSENLSKIDLYKLTQSPELQVIKNLMDGEMIKVGGYCYYEDVKESTGEVADLLSIMDADTGVCYACQSATFKRSFEDIKNLMDGEQFTIKKLSGTTKSGRPYVNCALVG